MQGTIRRSLDDIKLRKSPFCFLLSAHFVPLRQGGRAKRRGWISPLILSLRFPQVLFYHLHLPWGEHSLVFTVAYTFEGIEEATGEAQFLTEEVDGSLVAAVGIVE